MQPAVANVFLGHFLCLLCVVGIGLLVNGGINGRSGPKFRNGLKVLAWVATGYIVGGFVGAALSNGTNRTLGEMVPSVSCLGLIVGAVVGNVVHPKPAEER